ncbi:nucleotidyltransferase family protein [Janibacter hoylei]|uniref:nucleotidyltransferase family protein n=1 Tax=Janibacter hoylei TaxID=364298 RepID=UPI0024919EBA|nr:nucleotidyltransferase family protein [Janibacter hoylei]
MSDALTIDEALPLGAVAVQRVLDRAGVRSLMIKGSAFAELGVRSPKAGNDIDLLIDRSDRDPALAALASAGWITVSPRTPGALEGLHYSTTMRHPHLIPSLDLHHTFAGLLDAPGAFEAMWVERTTIELAHQPVAVPCVEHAALLEALNALKDTRPADWPQVSHWLADACDHLDVDLLSASAEPIGARHSAAPFITALGGAAPDESVPTGYEEWVSGAGRTYSYRALRHTLRRAPHLLPWTMWWLLTLNEEAARLWASTHGVEYRGRWRLVATRVASRVPEPWVARVRRKWTWS